MIMEQSTPLQKAIEVFESLPFEDQDLLLELLSRRRADNRREEIAANARATVNAVREKKAFFGSVNDLRRELTKE